ncbi:hypothetical protein [Solitalea koreensis]|uniref:PH domain-containing protein n=1 Tax=Solitalea koreensis TaxID=543615 RepID=A0A521AS42_9SPHI|nr:hypothetical protein [Solitalea koreensis]SMO37609.1 hypothetical protein SAMN06265350_101357 [Solitalea koreensis]
MKEKALFVEKQFLGLNRNWLLTRLVLAIFCFVIYYFDADQNNADILLVVGISILIISIILTFIIHYKTLVFENCVVLDGFWTTRRIKIDFGSVQSVEKAQYSNFLLNNPVYNLHKKGTIRFYTRGKYAAKLTDKDGLIYMIGSQQPDELVRVIKEQLKN